MRNKYILQSLVVAVLMFASACRDFVDPIIPYSDFDTGTYLRTIRVASPSSVAPSLTMNFFNLDNAKFEATIEAVSEVGGTNVDNVTVSVRLFRVTETGPVNIPAQPVLIRTIPGSDFTTNSENRFTRTTFSVTAAEATSAVGLTFDQLEGGDFFDFSLELTTTDGRVFNNANLSADVQGGFFYDSPFFYRVGVICPSDLGGTYDYVSSEMSSAFGSCPGTITGEVTLSQVGSTPSYAVSDATFGFWGCYGDSWGNGTVFLNDACGGLSFSGSDKYGDGYAFTFISNDGTNLRFNWLNNSGETGNVTLIAPAGSTWPADLR